MIKDIQNIDNTKLSAENLSIRVNPKLISQSITAGYLPALALYYLLKRHYNNNGRIYKIPGSKQRVSKLSGLSIPTVNKYFKILESRGLLREDRGAWMLIPNRSRAKAVISITRDTTAAQIKSLLILKHLESEGRQQAFVESIYKFLSGREGGKHQNKLKSGDSFAPHLSVRYIAKVCNISVNTARKALQTLNTAGELLTVYSDPVFLFNGSNNNLDLLSGHYGYRYFQNNAVYEIPAGRHYFLANPIKFKEMTLKQYRKIRNKNGTVRELCARIQRELSLQELN